MKQLED
jgi:growth arrest-specific protein 8